MGYQATVSEDGAWRSLMSLYQSRGVTSRWEKNQRIPRNS